MVPRPHSSVGARFAQEVNDMSLVDKLRDEVIEAQRAQAAVAHWKLLLIATFGAAGLGLFPDSGTSNHHVLVLGLLPFVCSYADVLSYNTGIRVLSIARYFRVTTRDAVEAASNAFADAKNYEQYTAKHRALFDLEVVALRWTSETVSVAVTAVGILIAVWPGLYALQGTPVAAHAAVAGWLITSGLVGALLADDLYYRHRRNVRRFDGSAARRPRRSLCALAAGFARIGRRRTGAMHRRDRWNR